MSVRAVFCGNTPCCWRCARSPLPNICFVKNCIVDRGDVLGCVEEVWLRADGAERVALGWPVLENGTCRFSRYRGLETPLNVCTRCQLATACASVGVLYCPRAVELKQTAQRHSARLASAQLFTFCSRKPAFTHWAVFLPCVADQLPLPLRGNYCGHLQSVLLLHVRLVG